MKCRKMIIWKDENEKIHRDICWFGSVGKDENGNGLFVENDKHSNYGKDGRAIRDLIIQKLSIIKGEIWTDPSFGIPLFDKLKNKGVMDSYIINQILKIDGVNNIVNFQSNIENNSYVCNLIVETDYGNINMEL